jgi:hypothetical protein
MALLQEYGIDTQVARSNPCVLSVRPPLTVTAEQVARFLDALAETCSELASLFDVADRVLTRSVGSHQGQPAGHHFSRRRGFACKPIQLRGFSGKWRGCPKTPAHRRPSSKRNNGGNLCG